MSKPDTLRGTYVEILMGDGESPQLFSVLCGINTRSITDQVNTSDSFVRDCADPEDIPIRELILSGRQWSMRGSGQMNRALLKDLDAAVGKIKDYRFFIRAKQGETALDDPLNGYYGGQAAITSKVINGNDGDYVNIDVAFESHGAWEWTDVVVA